MTHAVYFCSGDLSPPEYHHYGLAAPLYTHFTSPIRRYADVTVHRLLAASLGIDKLPPVFQDKAQLTSIADNLNYRHRNAKWQAGPQWSSILSFTSETVPLTQKPG
ncbi:exosome complex exonuclease RRP44 homolog A-like [Hibiscus syriacus]|uniref:exosome complex exonuclease RRP44 homolog A-like n=1 Tax=Hibiscus syriacus TaxID=106335 RepID=UPI001925036A|nr:exosome complex exonuclease RRP44 homolog A-like [Hibiscus syriacus]